MIEGYDDDYRLIGGDYEESAVYLFDEDGRHIFMTGTEHGGYQVSDAYYAVPDSVKLPAAIKVSGRCALLVPKDTLDENTQWADTSKGKAVALPECTLVKVHYTDIFLYIMVWLYLAFSIYHFIRLVITVQRRAKLQSENVRVNDKKKA